MLPKMATKSIFKKGQKKYYNTIRYMIILFLYWKKNWHWTSKWQHLATFLVKSINKIRYRIIIFLTP
jgi:hypothetical protein